MIITIFQKGSRYGFLLRQDPEDSPAAGLQSDRDNYLVDGLPSTYPTFGEAHAYAKQLANHPYHLAARKTCFQHFGQNLSPQETYVSHYGEMVSLLKMHFDAIMSDSPVSEQNVENMRKTIESVRSEVESILPLVNIADKNEEVHELLKEMDRMLEKCDEIIPSENEDEEQGVEFQNVSESAPAAPPLVKSSPVSSLGTQASRQIAQTTGDEELDGGKICRAYAEMAVEALSAKHPHAYLKSLSHNPQSKTTTAIIAEPNGNICALLFDSLLTMFGIIPGERSCHYHSIKFYEDYWQPIVEAVGHMRNGDVILVTNYQRPLQDGLGKWRGFDLQWSHKTISAQPIGQKWSLKVISDDEPIANPTP